MHICIFCMHNDKLQQHTKIIRNSLIFIFYFDRQGSGKAAYGTTAINQRIWDVSL